MNPIFPYLKLTLGVLFICLAAQCTFQMPTTDIPITGQSVAVLLVGYALGSRWGSLAVLIYLLLGIIGLPVFADGASGFGKILGASGGFLYGFVFAAYLVGRLSERRWDQYLGYSILAMTLGTIVILLSGGIQLSILKSPAIAWEYGIQPFLLGALVKIFLGAIPLPLFHFIRRQSAGTSGQC